MKIKYLMLPCVATLAMTSCVSNDTPDAMVGNGRTIEVTLNATREGFAPDVRSTMTENEKEGIDFSWSDTDEILVTFDSGVEAGRLTYSGAGSTGSAGIFRGKVTVFSDNPTFNYYFLGGEGTKDDENFAYTVNLKYYGTDASVYAGNDVLMARQENVPLKGNQLNTSAKLSRPFAFHKAVFKFPVTVPAKTDIVYNANGLKTSATVSLKDASKDLELGGEENMKFTTTESGTDFSFYFYVAPGKITERNAYCKIGDEIYVAAKNDLTATVNDNFISTFNMVKEVKKYNLTVNAYDNNGTHNSQSETQYNIAETKFPYSFDLNFDVPTYAGYIFKGWASSADATAEDVITTGKIVFDSPNELVKEIYAVWEPEEDEWVDLDLPSRNKWRNRNINAATKIDFGTYFAWGETREFNSSKISDYKGFLIYSHVGSYREYQGTYYDTAKQLISGSLTPTQDDWIELVTECSLKWETINGIKGVTVVGSNGNSIFLPAAGMKYNTGKIVSENLECYYWSSDFKPRKEATNSVAAIIGFEEANLYNDLFDVYFYWRAPVRPIKK